MTTTPEKKWNDKGRRKKRLLILIGGPALLAVVGLGFYLFGDRYVGTDNAYLKTQKVGIAAEVSGLATEVNVDDNLHFAKGDVLFRVDDEPYRIAVERNKAALANTVADIESIRADYREKAAQLAKSEENVRYWSKENTRYQQLAKSNSVSAVQADQTRHEWQNAVRERDAVKQELESQLAKLANDPDIAVEEHPRYLEAKANLAKAELDLSRVTVRAPMEGVAANVSLEKGEYIAPGMPLFSLVATKHVWVEANFKETDLTHVRVGMPATVEVDTYPSREFHAKVVSVTPATGAEFSLLPPQNASGNWVKVVQRIMVKLEFDGEDENPPALSAGMSSDVSIDTGHTRLARWFGANDAAASEEE